MCNYVILIVIKEIIMAKEIRVFETDKGRDRTLLAKIKIKNKDVASLINVIRIFDVSVKTLVTEQVKVKTVLGMRNITRVVKKV